jgi:hypothetical protein
VKSVLTIRVTISRHAIVESAQSDPMIRSKWFDSKRQAARSRMTESDACTVGVIFLLLTGLLIAGMVVLVQTGVL